MKTASIEILRDDDGKPRRIYCPRGITFPAIHSASWFSADTGPIGPRWTGCNIRRLSDPDVFAPLARGGKCMAMLGTEKGGLYPFPSIEPSQAGIPALIVEGELDALIGNQEVGHLVHVVTLGGSTTKPPPSALEAPARCSGWLVATDFDAAGSAAAWMWKEIDPDKAHRAILPHGKDLAEFHANGGDVLAWVHSELDRLGWMESPR